MTSSAVFSESGLDVTMPAQTGMDKATYLDELSMKLEVKGKLLCDMFSEMSTFEVKLSLLHQHSNEPNLKSFSI